MSGELHVQLAEQGADAKRLHELTAFLRGPLLHLGVDEIPTLRGRMHACVAGRNTHQQRAGIARCAAVTDRCAAAAGDIPAAVSIN